MFIHAPFLECKEESCLPELCKMRLLGRGGTSTKPLAEVEKEAKTEQEKKAGVFEMYSFFDVID